MPELKQKIKQIPIRKRRGQSALSIIDILIAISIFISIMTVLYGLFQGDPENFVNFILSHIAIFEIIIELPFGISIFVVISAAGVTARIKLSGT